MNVDMPLTKKPNQMKLKHNRTEQKSICKLYTISYSD